LRFVTAVPATRMKRTALVSSCVTLSGLGDGVGFTISRRVKNNLKIRGMLLVRRRLIARKDHNFVIQEGWPQELPSFCYPGQHQLLKYVCFLPFNLYVNTDQSCIEYIHTFLSREEFLRRKPLEILGPRDCYFLLLNSRSREIGSFSER
jgi:hypothetical protein